MKVITVKVPKAYIDELNKLIEAGLFPSRSEAIRIAIRDLLRKELWIEQDVRRIRLEEV